MLLPVSTRIGLKGAKMVVCPTDHSLQADVIFVVEGTAVNGAYINDLKTNYVIPSLEYFNQGIIDDSNYISENANTLYGIVVYHAADCLPHLSSDTFGPFSSPGKLLSAIEKLELVGGKGESHCNVAEGLATALHCFEELQQTREASATVQKHCILVCNSPPYLMPVLESQTYSGKTAEQLAGILQDKSINLSVISPRKIPSLYKLFEKAGGDLSSSQTKNYAKDPRHLVLLKGYNLKERPISPPPVNNQNQLSNTSLPSPLAGSDSPISGNAQNNANLMGNAAPPNQVYRPQNTQGTQGMVPPQGGLCRMGMHLNAPPGYHPTGAGFLSRASPNWPMPPPAQQPRGPYLPQSGNTATTCGSALIAQLTQPSISGNSGVNQFGQINANASMNKINLNQQQQQGNVVGQGQQQNAPGIQQQSSQMPQVSQPNQVVTSQASQSAPQTQQQQPQHMGPVRERHTIWQGLLEWIDKPKNATDQPKIAKHVPCQVSANSKDGEPELKADGWPQKLIMQLMPKQLIGNIGGAYLKNSKSVLFHPQQCEALESLTRVMSSGFAGCVHFTSAPNPAACDIKVLILLYTPDKRAYLGFIPNDQVAFVDRLRKVIQQQKSTQQLRHTGQAGSVLPQGPQGGGPIAMAGTPPQMAGNNPTTSQGQPIMLSQTNPHAMAGGQITQNVQAPGANPNQGIINNIMGQNPGMRPQLRMPPPQQQQQQQQPNAQAGMIGAPQRPPFETIQLQAERQHNLEKINQLKQTLEAAQQQEQQYKSQLERISHMKTAQLQEALQVAQQTEMQYKMLDQQRLASQGPSAQAGNAQQRIMRPGMSNNPGLRHLLQQQPQYRQQMMGMQQQQQQQIGGNGNRPQMAQQMPNQQAGFDDVANFDFNNIM